MLAAILEQAGFVPAVPKVSHPMGTPESEAQSRVPNVPNVPNVPVQKDKGETKPTTHTGGLEPMRVRLLALAVDAAIDRDLVHRLADEDVQACIGCSNDVLRAYVRALGDSDLRERGRVPADETATALCRHCGPVWLHPHVAACAPVVDGWPRVLGCPWCHVRSAGGYVPCPLVTCGDCAHFIRDTINPGDGMGSCGAGMNPARPWPSVTHQCASFRPIHRYVCADHPPTEEST